MSGSAPSRGVQVTRLRELNARAVLTALRSDGAATAPELAVRLGLTKPTVAASLRMLAAAGVVHSLGTRAGRSGRAPELWDVDHQAGAVVGVDVGTQVVRAALADLAGQTVARTRVPIVGPRATDLLATLDRAVDQVMAEAGTDRSRVSFCVVGVPGVVDPSGAAVRLSPNLPALADPAFVDGLRARFADRFALLKDVFLAASGEVEAVGSGGDDFALVTVGNGVGSAVVRNGSPVLGSTGLAGEIGYLPLRADDDASDGRAPLEEAASVTGLLREARARGRSWASADAVFDAAEAGDAIAIRLVAREAALVAHGVATLVLAADPARVVLTGSIALRGGADFCALVTAGLDSRLPIAAPPVELARSGTDGTVDGAVAVARDAAWTILVDGLTTD